jgi:hypothetical protein
VQVGAALALRLPFFDLDAILMEIRVIVVESLVTAQDVAMLFRSFQGGEVG